MVSRHKPNFLTSVWKLIRNTSPNGDFTLIPYPKFIESYRFLFQWLIQPYKPNMINIFVQLFCIDIILLHYPHYSEDWHRCLHCSDGLSAFLHETWTPSFLMQSLLLFSPFTAFLFKHANSKQFGRKGEGQNGEDTESLISGHRMAMLTSWLPLLCQASNGTDTPILSSKEKAEMVKVLEEMIETLSEEQQEVVLALWLQYYTSCPDSDWPNLEACYRQWYSRSRNLLLMRLEE